MLQVRVLGPLQVEVDGQLTAVTAPLQRAVLASLALARGHVLTRDQLVDGLWDHPPANAVNAVQQYVSALRGRLGRDRVGTVGAGYRLEVGAESVSVDVDRFHALTVQARQRHQAGDLGAAGRLLAEAVGLWRGTALADVPECPFLAPARAALNEALLEARLLQLAVEDDLGHAPAMVAAAETLASEHQLDEAVSAQLMRTLAGAGRTADALEVFERMRARLADELGVDPGQQLRDAQAAVLTQDPTLVAAPTAAWLPDSVPRPANRLLGRDQELADLEHLLQDPGTRLATLSGPGGVGKTRLAVEVARRARATRETVYVPLDVLATADLVIPTIATALQLKPAPDSDLAAQIAAVVGGRDLLLVLDNFEHVIDAAPHLARLLGLAVDGPQVLVTSRESLRIGGEHLYRVDPLATSACAEAGGSDGIPEFRVPAAVELFWQRAAAASPGFRRDDDPDAVAGICAQLDGLPLAIELAAARTNVLAPGKILERLTRRLSLLTTGTRDAPNRHRSLRACLEWSVGLLTNDEQRLLAAASVFVGGATITSLEAVCGQVLLDVDILANIDSLVAKSLLLPVTDPSGPRFAMLETIREYATELLTASGNEQTVRLAHAHHYHDLIARECTLLPYPPRNVEELTNWSAELPNARAAMRTFELAGETGPRTDLAIVLCRVWKLHGSWAEVDGEVAALWQLPDLPRARRIDLLYWSAGSAWGQDDHAKVLRLANEGLALNREAKEPNWVQEALLRVLLESVAFDRGDAVRQTEELQKALAASQLSGDAELIAFVGSRQPLLGSSTKVLGDVQRALTAARERDNQILEAAILHNASEGTLTCEDPMLLAHGEEWGRQGHEIGVALRDLEGQAISLCNAGAAVLLAGGSAAQATADLKRSLELASRIGNISLLMEALLRLAAGEAAQEHPTEAAFFWKAWRGLTPEDDLAAVSASNRRIIDTFLAHLAAQPFDTTDPSVQLTLAEAVAVALGERSLPPATDVAAPSSRLG